MASNVLLYRSSVSSLAPLAREKRETGSVASMSGPLNAYNGPITIGRDQRHLLLGEIDEQV